MYRVCNGTNSWHNQIHHWLIYNQASVYVKARILRVGNGANLGHILIHNRLTDN